MLNIYFTGDDLARTSLASGPDPLWEVLLSLHVLRQKGFVGPFTEWRGQVRPALPGSTRLLLELAPPIGYSPDFLTPCRGPVDLEAGIDLVLSTPASRLRTDLAELARRQPATPWTRALAGGEAGTVRRLGDAIREYFQAGLATRWELLRSRVEGERAVRSRVLASGGVEGLLGSLHPQILWSSPVLRVGGYPDQELSLDGRGILLVPSLFCQHPITLKDPAEPPVLVFPIDHTGLRPGPAASGGVVAGHSRTLAALLGRTRATILQTLADPLSTTELAHRLRISAAAASHHTTILRNAGLISTRRHRNAVVHTATASGMALVQANP